VLHHEVFTIFCIYNNILFTILVLNASVGLKVCLKCTSNYNFHFLGVILLTRILAMFTIVVNY
jgi:hypothetical protein